jgi:GDPmannose 4,6-dehydratase
MTASKKALITGIAGQDGSYLAELLLKNGYRVCGIEHPTLQQASLPNLVKCIAQLELFFVDIEDAHKIDEVVSQCVPDEIYHLAAATFVSFDPASEQNTLRKNILGTSNLLSACKKHAPNSRFFYAGTSEMFGEVNHQPQTLATPFSPRSVYGIAKLAGHHLVKYYRDHHNLFAVTGILYNHESPRRGQQFVTQKIAHAAAAIKVGIQKDLALGNIDAARDWGHAQDFVNGMWLQLQFKEQRDFIFATGQTRTVRDFLECAFKYVDLNYQNHVYSSNEFFRPTEKVPLVGDPSDARVLLGWKEQHSFESMVKDMVDFQLKRLSESL